MDLEFHYYINYLIALKAGFSDESSFKIAYSAQYVDDNRIKRNVNEAIKSSITHSYRIISNRKATEQLYFCLHFVPDGKDLIVKPNGAIALKMLKASLKTNNPYAIGIASHAYADTWAHQNFIGCFHSHNASNQLGTQLIPNIGHADFMHQPDIINLNWYDDRIKQHISNKQRFLSAAEHLYYHYCSFTNCLQDKNFILQLDELIGAECQSVDQALQLQAKRIKRYKSFATQNFHHSIINYNKNQWWKELKNISSDWNQFQIQAESFKNAIWHQIKHFFI